MGYSSKDTYEAIMNCAKDEFLEKGFQKASMRRIAEKAGLTTGAMYNHFKNKEMIFEALVGDVAEGLYKLFVSEHELCHELDSYIEDEAFDTMSDSTNKIIDYMFDNYEIMKLILSSSHGTKYEHFGERLIEVEEISTRKMMEKTGYKITAKDEFFIHTMASSGMVNTYEVVKHGLTREEAYYYMEKIQKFYYAGWNEILNQELKLK